MEGRKPSTSCNDSNPLLLLLLPAPLLQIAPQVYHQQKAYMYAISIS